LDVSDYYEVQRWLRAKSNSTKGRYLLCIKRYCDFTKLNPTELIDEAENDRKGPRRSRGKPEDRLLQFQEHLNEYKQQGRKNFNSSLSDSTISIYFNAIRSFYNSNQFWLGIKSPKAVPREVNCKFDLRAKDVRTLLDCTTNLRDRAIILVMFQSGIAVAELCRLNYGDISKEFEECKIPLCLHLIRKKEKVEFDTFIGLDAVKSLKLYLQDRIRRGENLCYTSPLFIKEGTKKRFSQRIHPRLVQIMMSIAAIKSGLVSVERMEVADFNPVRPHALRSSFISIMKLAGASETAVEYMAGHTLDGVRKAYFKPRLDELREIYCEYEPYLSVSNIPNSDHNGSSELNPPIRQNAKTRFKRTLDNVDKRLLYSSMQKNRISEGDQPRIYSRAAVIPKLQDCKQTRFSSNMTLGTETLTTFPEENNINRTKKEARKDLKIKTAWLKILTILKTGGPFALSLISTKGEIPYSTARNDVYILRRMGAIQSCQKPRGSYMITDEGRKILGEGTWGQMTSRL